MIKSIEYLTKKFKEANISDWIDFNLCENSLDKALWVLYVAKEKIGQPRLTAEQIAVIIVNVEERTMTENSITNSLKRAFDKVHRYHENGLTYYEIMKPGKEYLLTLQNNDLVNAFYFEPDTKYTTKGLLKNQILNDLTGDIKIVDPYCGERTLDLLDNLKENKIKLLTKIENLREQDRRKLIREFADFKTENPNIEFRNYPNMDIHDRYVISADKVILIGHSLKDLGAKESFAIILDLEHYKEIYDALNGNFNRRWNISSII